MAITPYPPSPHLVANPYCVYYRQPDKNLIRQTLLEQRVWWREEQAGWIQNYLEIPPEFGEPLLAVMLCAVGDEKEFEDSTMWMGGQNEAGEWVKLTDLLGKDEGHVYRCRESAYKLRDAVEWRAIARVGGTLPENLPWPPQIALPDLLGWAINNGVSLTESGQFAWVSACQSSSTSPSELNYPSPANWIQMNLWLRSVREKWSRKDKWTLKEIRQAYSKLEEMEGKYGRIQPSCDALLARLNKIRYECDWTLELGARLRAALENMGFVVDDNPIATQDNPNITKPVVVDKSPNKHNEMADELHVLLNRDKGYKTYSQIAEMYRFDLRTKENLRKRLKGLNRKTSAARKTSAGKKKYHKDGDKRQGYDMTEPLYEYNVENDSVKAAIRYYIQSDTATQK